MNTEKFWVSESGVLFGYTPFPHFHFFAFFGQMNPPPFLNEVPF